MPFWKDSSARKPNRNSWKLPPSVKRMSTLQFLFTYQNVFAHPSHVNGRKSEINTKINLSNYAASVHGRKKYIYTGSSKSTQFLASTVKPLFPNICLAYFQHGPQNYQKKPKYWKAPICYILFVYFFTFTTIRDITQIWVYDKRNIPWYNIWYICAFR